MSEPTIAEAEKIKGFEPLLTPEDLCEIFNAKLDWVYDQVQNNRIAYYRVGGRHIRFSREDVADYLRLRRQEIGG